MAHALAIQIRDKPLDDIAAQLGDASKLCSGCDPDVPGHVARAVCKVCHGTGREELSLLKIVNEMREKPTKHHGGACDDDLYITE